MGTVGLSFGSPTSGQGFDVASTVTAIVTNLQNAESPYKTQLTALQAQDTALSSLGGLLSTLSTDLQSLTDPTGPLAGKLGASSDTNSLVLSSAGSTAVAGSHTITVSQLAQVSSVYSQPLGSADVLSGTLSIQVGSGAAQTISVDPASPTLAGLAQTINGAGIGITASVITDGTGSRLNLVSQTSGAAGTVVLSGAGLNDATQGLSPSFTVAQSGRDAQMVVDGVPVSSASNTVSGVLPGVTFQLLNITAAPVQVQITNDTATANTAVSAFVKDYNAVVQSINGQEGKSASGAPQPLYGNPLLAGVQQQLSSALNVSGGGAVRTIADLGLQLNNNGTLALNSDELTSALTSQYASMQSFFQAAGGFGLAMQSAVDGSGSDAPLGAVAQAEKANASVESNLNYTIGQMETGIAQRKSQLTAQLNAANQTLQLIPMEVNQVNEIYAAISGYSSSKN